MDKQLVGPTYQRLWAVMLPCAEVLDADLVETAADVQQFRSLVVNHEV